MTKVKNSTNPAALPPNDRRRHERLPLRLPVRFINDGRPSNACFTENISSGGFYCVALDRFTTGDRLTVELSLPAHFPGREGKRVLLKCQAQVVRLDSTWFGAGCGVAFQIEKCALYFDLTDTLR
jgi:hypothetical protein